MKITKIKRKSDGKIFEFVTQQYETGLYCIVNNDPASQCGLDETEEDFHKKIKEQAIKDNDEILDNAE